LSKDKTPGGSGDVIVIDDDYAAGSSSYGGTVENSAVFQTGHVQLTQDAGAELYGQVNYNTGSLGSDFTMEANIEFKDSSGGDGASIFLYYTNVDVSTESAFNSNFTGYCIQVQTNSNILALRKDGVQGGPNTAEVTITPAYMKDIVYNLRWVVTGGNTHEIYLDDVLKITHTEPITGYQYVGVAARTPITFSTEYRVHDFTVTKQGIAEEKKCVIEFPQENDVDPHLRVGFGTDASLKVNRQGEISIPKQLIRSYRQITDSDDALETDYRIGVNHSAPCTVTLPLINDLTTESKRLNIVIYDEAGVAATHPITIQCSGADTLNGLASMQITGNYNSFSVWSNGSSWFLA
jgi:hypothetical protein